MRNEILKLIRKNRLFEAKQQLMRRADLIANIILEGRKIELANKVFEEEEEEDEDEDKKKSEKDKISMDGEDVDQIDELSRSLISRYVKKASKSNARSSNDMNKRRRGMKMAASALRR